MNTPPSFVIVSLIRSMAFSSAFSPSAFSGVDVVITVDETNKWNKVSRFFFQWPLNASAITV